MRDEALRRERPESATVPTRLLSVFIGLFSEVFPNDRMPAAPERTIRRLLRRSRPIFGPYFACDRWVFEVSDGELKDVLIAPSVTVHARERLEERFGIRLYGEDDVIRLAIRIANAVPLSQGGRRKYRIAGDVQARVADGCIFLLRERQHLVTVLSTDEWRSSKGVT